MATTIVVLIPFVARTSGRVGELITPVRLSEVAMFTEHGLATPESTRDPLESGDAVLRSTGAMS